eukprot:5174233-Prymnesium_polylepis.1
MCANRSTAAALAPLWRARAIAADDVTPIPKSLAAAVSCGSSATSSATADDDDSVSGLSSANLNAAVDVGCPSAVFLSTTMRPSSWRTTVDVDRSWTARSSSASMSGE